LDVAREDLLQMTTDGTLGLADLKNAFMNNADKIDANFGNLAYSISDAMLNIRNKWGLFLDGLNKSVGITQTVSRIMVRSFDLVLAVLKRLQTWFERLAKAVGGFDNLLKLLAITLAAVFAVIAASKVDVVAFIEKVSGGLSKINLKMLGIVAVIVLLALLVEDFFRFMRGENSLLGSLFDKAGIGAENARQSIIKIWNTISGFLIRIWDSLKAAAQTVFESMAAWWNENGESIKADFMRIWNAVKSLCLVAWQALSGAAKTIFGALHSFWNTWGDTVIAVFSAIWNTLIALIEPFLDALTAIISFLVNVFTGNWQGAWQNIKDLAAAIWSMIVKIISGAWDIICAIWSKLSEILGGFFQAALGVVSEKVKAIKDAVVNGFQTAIDWLKALPEQAFKWGADIIEGIVGGIKSAAGKVSDAVSGVANKIKSFIGFSKPDEGPLSDFDTYMPDMIDLMTSGIEAGRDKVVGALASLTEDNPLDNWRVDTSGVADNLAAYVEAGKNKLAQAAKGFAGQNPIDNVGYSEIDVDSLLESAKEKTVQALGKLTQNISVFAKANVAAPETVERSGINNNSNSSRVVTQNVNISNSFSGGDRETQKQGATAMKKTADDATRQMARGLAYAR